MNTPRNPVFTIGHSTHSIEVFMALLRQHGITAVADVRSSPNSRFNPQFNKEGIERELKKNGLKYIFMGRELGGRSEAPTCYENGRIRYARLAQTELFNGGIDRLILGSNDYRIALMCAEKEPLECHRTLLIAPALVVHGLEVEHIHADGKLELHQAAMERLLDLVGLPHEDLFRTRNELILEALTLREEQVAYVIKKTQNNLPREIS